MIQRIIMRWVAMCIEWHWMFVVYGRKKIGRLLDSGVSLTCKKLQRMDKMVTTHGNKAIMAQYLYEDLAGITVMIQKTYIDSITDTL